MIRMSNGSNSGEITPRNIVWVEDKPPDFTHFDRALLTASRFTHAIACFFHLNDKLQLVYDGPDSPYDPKYDEWWGYLWGLRQQQYPKTLMMSVGGWNSGTWEWAEGKAAAAAAQIVDFARAKGFDGIDFNFEGPYPFPKRFELYASFAQLIVEVRKIWTGIFTITPIYGELSMQLGYIEKAVAPASWQDYLSWINVQFYVYQDTTPVPNADVPGDYDNVLAKTGAPPGKIAVGFPLSTLDTSFNVRELDVAKSAVTQIFQKYPGFAGLFAWRFRGVFLGSGGNTHLNWAWAFFEILHIR
jgi:hypothetical protein